MLRKTFLPPIADLLAFEAAARHASISRAAAELHLTQSAVSRQVRQLEAHLGMALFHRVRQRVVLTDAGRVYAAELRAALQQLSGATQKIMAFSGGGGLLNLAVLPTLGTRWLIPRLGDFHTAHPGITLDLTTRAEPFMFNDTAFDAAIHYGDPVWPGAIADYLFGEDMVPVCSPALLKNGAPIAPEELEHLPLLHQSARPDAWREWFAAAGLLNVNAMGGARYELFSMLVEAALAELGVALVPRFFVLNEIASGELVVPCTTVLHSQRSYYLVYPENKVGSASLQTFCHWLREQAHAYREVV